MAKKYNILIMGASYGSLLASKMLFGGHNVKLVCLPAEADLINAEGFRVRMPIRGRKDPIEIDSRKLPGKVSAAGAVSFGSGFTVSRTAVGVYSISFTTAFPSGQFPIVTASAESNGTVARFAMVNSPSNFSVTIRIVNGSGTAADADFYFIAAGTR